MSKRDHLTEEQLHGRTFGRQADQSPPPPKPPPDPQRKRRPRGMRTAPMVVVLSREHNPITAEPPHQPAPYSPRLSAEDARAQRDRWNPIDELRRQRKVAALGGNRLTYELLVAYAEKHGGLEELDRFLDDFAGIDGDVLRAVGGDRFPPRSIRRVK